MRALIVDDNDVNLYMLRCLLAGNGYQVAEAKNGEIALEILQNEVVDLIISDILMPVMDGFTFCRTVKKDPETKHIPFIFYTATYTGPKDEEFAREIGADHFLVKPCEPDVLLAAIDEVLAKATAGALVSADSPRDEETILKLYNERLVRKLEQKMMEAEKEVEARREAEEALRRSEALLNATQRIGKIGGWEWDVARQEMFWTQETYRVHDLDPTAGPLTGIELLRLNLKCYAEKDKPLVSKAFRRCHESGIPFELECDFVSLKGREMVVLAAGTPVIENNLVVKILGYLQDITERKHAEAEQDKLKEQFLQAQKLESIGQLAGGVAHDFNNILTVILGYGEVVYDSLPDDNPLRRDADEIVKAGQRASNLTRQLLIFSRKHVAEPEIVDVNTVIKDLNSMLRRLIGEHIEFDSKPGCGLHPIKVDPGQLQQVIMNLVINARDAMPRGGKLSIETFNTTVSADTAGNIAGLEPGEHVSIVVSDTGHGMTRETMNRIFEPFFTTKEKGKGTGLGLSTVYGIVSQAGGVIDVASTPDVGTTFTILLPATSDVSAKEQDSESETDFGGHGELLLLVEDEVSLRMLIEKMLVLMGYSVVTAGNGIEALALVTEEGLRPDLVISDVIMPEMNGLEMMEGLKRLMPDLKMLFMSGYTDDVIIRHFVVDAEYPFIQKPFTSKGLARQIYSLLRQS